jgi:hypothetical protein
MLMVLIGFVLLVLGRRMFWLFVGGVGFILGFWLTSQVVTGDGNARLVVLAVALIFGLAGALIARMLQRLAVGLAGFVAGGYVLTGLAHMLGWEMGSASWVLFLVGGVIGAGLVAGLFEWALILLSSFTGATLIIQNLPAVAGNWQVPMLASLGIYIVLVLFGMSVQSSMWRHEPHSKHALP